MLLLILSLFASSKLNCLMRSDLFHFILKRPSSLFFDAWSLHLSDPLADDMWSPLASLLTWHRLYVFICFIDGKNRVKREFSLRSRGPRRKVVLMIVLWRRKCRVFETITSARLKANVARANIDLLVSRPRNLRRISITMGVAYKTTAGKLFDLFVQVKMYTHATKSK